MAISPLSLSNQVYTGLTGATSSNTTSTAPEKAAKSTLDYALKQGDASTSVALYQGTTTAALYGVSTSAQATTNNPYSLLPQTALNDAYADVAQSQLDLALAAYNSKNSGTSLALDGGLTAKISTEAKSGDYALSYSATTREFSLTNPDGSVTKAKANGVDVDFGNGIALRIGGDFYPGKDAAPQAFEVSRLSTTA